MPSTADPVRSPGLLLCEGPDDFAFLLSMLSFLRIGEETVRIERLGGRGELHDRLNGLPIRDARGVLRSLAVVCDTDDPDDGPAAFGRIRDDLRATGYTPPVQAAEFAYGPWAGGALLAVGVFVMPDNQATGSLEDLCLSAIAGDPSLPCIDAYLECVSRAGGIAWRTQDRSKARLHSWLASRHDPTLLLGYAMNANQIDRGHAVFEPIRKFLTDLAAAAQTTDNAPSA